MNSGYLVCRMEVLRSSMKLQGVRCELTLGNICAVLVSIDGSLNTLFEQMRRSEGPSVIWWAFDQRGLIRLKPRFVHVNKVKASPQEPSHRTSCLAHSRWSCVWPRAFRTLSCL